MSYHQFTKDYVAKKNVRDPIYIWEVGKAIAKAFEIPEKKAAAAASVAMKRIMDRQEIADLRMYQKGIYYRTKGTYFGEMGIRRRDLVYDKYLSGDQGYETGYSLLNTLGLTTQMPNRTEYATNATTGRLKKDPKLFVYVKAPKTRIDTENIWYLQILDALELMNHAPVDAEDPFGIIAGYIADRGLDYETLLYYANRYYNRETVWNLACTAGRKKH